MKTKKIEIREATINDIDSILNIQDVVWPILYSSEEGETTEKNVTESMKPKSEELANVWHRVISTHHDKGGESNTWVAKDDDKVVGFGYAVKEPNEGQIRSLYILPEYQESGAGSMLMNYILDWFSNSMDITLESNKAIKFFEKFGFKKTEKTSIQKLKNGKEIIEYEMRRKMV